MKNFKDRVVVITGAGSGIGRALAQSFASEGAQLALADNNEANLAETAKQLGDTRLVTETLDVANREAVYSFADKVKAEFGGADIVINNAGVTFGNSVEDSSYEDFEWLMGINFWGVVYGTKAFLPMLKAADEGVVVNISSVFGIIAFPNQAAYNASKFAVRGFTEALRHEMTIEGSKLLAISVHPGGIKTNIARNARFYKDHDGVTDHAKVAADFEQIAKTTPEQAAATIIKGIQTRNPRVLIGNDAWLIDRIQRVMPVNYMKAILGMMNRMRPKDKAQASRQQKA
ncbi:MAG: SDR family NAD(P)-dependent oxidoreductase [Nevskiales bacterium]